MISPYCHVSLLLLNGRLLDLKRMDSQSRAFEAPHEKGSSGAATPLRCHQTMKPQPLVPWTPTRLLGALLMALVSAPALLLQPATTRRRA
jgi:hypothetical protein